MPYVKGHIHSLESKQKMSRSHIGLHVSSKTKQKISASRMGHIVSLETRQKLRQAHEGSHLSDETKLKISKSCMGRHLPPLSLESRQKISKATRHRVMTDEHFWFKGHHHSAEERKRISDRMKIAHKLGKYKKQYKNAKSCYKHGFFYSNKNKKDIYYRSSWELRVYEIFERISKILSYEAEPFKIQYNINDSIKNYVPDILVNYDDGSKELIEIKSSRFLNNPVNILKFEAGRKYAKDNNMKFVIMTKLDINKIQQCA